MKGGEGQAEEKERQVLFVGRSKMGSRQLGLATRAIHAGRGEKRTGPVVTPIHQTASFLFESAEEGAAIFSDQQPGYAYTRWGNPNIAELERKVADLEGATAAMAAASGMAAVAAAMLSLLREGEHLIADYALYSATYNLFADILPRYGINTTFVDVGDPHALARACRPTTKAVYFESPGNPALKLVDIRAVTDFARSKGLTTVFDNTFATPCLQQPLSLGVDVVIHSATKYLAGHGDVIAGLVVGQEEFIGRLKKQMMINLGGVVSPFNAWLTCRGIATLPLRMERHCANAVAVARFLELDKRVEKVLYPGLASHPRHEVARRQMSGGFGGVVCFEVRGGLEAGRSLMNRVRLCILAVSLGDVHTLITHPASMTHVHVEREARLRAGISDGLIRLSVGLEDATDIIADLDQALEGAAEEGRQA